MNKLFIAIIIFVAGRAVAQPNLNGRILEDKTQAAIPYASVSVGYQNGTASNEQGEFVLTLSADDRQSKMEVSCIGFYSRRLSIDSLLRLGPHELKIYLKPFVTVLNEVTINGKKTGPREIVQDAIRQIPINYTQQPFNMTFYSRVSANDSATTKYLVETFVECYREGYREGARNHSKILHKRVTGQNPMPLYDKKRKMEYFAYEIIPGFDVFLVDMVGSGTKYSYTIFNPEYFKRLEFRQKDISIFDEDTVFVVEYDQKNFRSEERKVSRESCLYRQERWLSSNMNEGSVKTITKLFTSSIRELTFHILLNPFILNKRSAQFTESKSYMKLSLKVSSPRM